MKMKIGLVASGTSLAFMTAATIWAWPQIADNAALPVHWNVYGEADRYMSKQWALSLLPLATVAVTALLAVVPRFEPRRIHLEQSRKLYMAAWVMVTLVLTGAHMSIVAAAVGQPIEIERIVPILIGATFLVIGNYLGKSRSNFVAGIRTPWTLSSEKSWDRTHRFGGKLFLLLGLSIVVSGIWAPAGVTFGLIMGGVVGILLVVVIYSYLVWRDDTERSAD